MLVSLSIMRATSTRPFLYIGLSGAALIIGYGLMKLVPAHPVQVIAVSAPIEPVVTQRAVIAKNPLRRGAVITANDLDVLPIEGPLPDAVQLLPGAVIGKVAVSDIPAFQFILASQISADPGRAGLALLIPSGFRAIAFRTNDEVAVANFIRPGDHVDVQVILPDTVLPGGTDPSRHPDGSASEAHTLLQDVAILAVGDLVGTVAEDTPSGAAPNRKIDPPRGVTLALTPTQVSQFVLARSLGTIFLSLRNPSDPQAIAQDTATLKAIRGQTAPPLSAVADSKRPIELVTGNQARTIYSVAPGSR